MSPFPPEQFEILLPLACEWAEAEEQRILKTGVPLTDAFISDARLMGVAEPHRVRLLHVREIPGPTHPMLLAASEKAQLISPFTAGLTLRYGIFIRADRRGERDLVVHELGHTAQYERLGGFEPFLRQYLLECFTIGYPQAPMEQEVIARSAEICGHAGR